MLRVGLTLCDYVLSKVYQLNGCDEEFNNEDTLITALFIRVKN